MCAMHQPALRAGWLHLRLSTTPGAVYNGAQGYRPPAWAHENHGNEELIDMSPIKGTIPKGNFIFQPSILRGHVFFGG